VSPAPPASAPHRPPGPPGGPGRWPLALLAGLLLALAFPAPGWWPLALPGVAILGVLALTAPPRRAFVETAAAGVLFFALLLRWFAGVIGNFTPLGAAAALGAVLVSGACLGLGLGLWGWTTARLAVRVGTAAGAALGAVLWVGYEVLRQWFPFPFPWGTLAAAHAPFGPARSAAALVGSFGLSLLVAGLALTLAAAVVRRSRPAAAATGAVALAAALAAGGGLVVQERGGSGARVNAAVAQGALPRDAAPADELAVYEELTVEAVERGAAVVVWPESSVSLRLDRDLPFRLRAEALSRRLDVDLVLTSVTSAPGGGIYNSAGLVTPAAGLCGLAHKRQLVPFGEYLPLRFVLGDVPAIAAEAGDFTPGEAPGLLAGQRGRLGALVCYESVFPGLGCEVAEHGADILVNMTNDSWFGTSAGPQQHLLHGLLRTVETGRPLVRAANTGISVLVDRRGRVRETIPLDARGVAVASLETGRGPAVGCRVGRWIAIGCATLSLAALVAAFFVPARPSGPRTPSQQEEDDDAERSDGSVAGPAEPGRAASGVPLTPPGSKAS
jgi:apolipoprotein N-acyltransferase